MTRGSRPAKHRAKQQAAAQNREQARRTAKDQYRPYTEFDEEPVFGFYQYADGFESGPEFAAGSSSSLKLQTASSDSGHGSS
jgi:hypothetical protein